MRLLLDTHVAIWAIAYPEQLPSRIATLIESEAEEVFVSAASIWEIAIEFKNARVGKPPFSGFDAIAEFRTNGYKLLSVTAEHAAEGGALELPHGDPFDRLILAQALVEPLRLVTADKQIASFSNSTITW